MYNKMGVIIDMFNKYYEKTKGNSIKIIKIIIISIIIVTINLITIPNYYINIGGGIMPISSRFIIDGEENDRGSDFYMAYVTQLNLTIPYYIYSLFLNEWKVEKVDSSNDENLLNKLLLENSINNAIISAYNLSDKKIIIKDINYIVVYIDSLAKTNLEMGDILLEIEDEEINNKDDYYQIIEKKESGEILNLKVMSKGEIEYKYIEIIEYQEELKLGISLISDYEYEIIPNIEIIFENDESGPSGGLMIALNLYEILSNKDITRGRKIVGTGMIDAEGNVLSISGIEYKFKAAVDAKADIFIVPKDINYEEVLIIQNQYNYNIEVIAVDTLEEAIEKLMFD